MPAGDAALPEVTIQHCDPALHLHPRPGRVAPPGIPADSGRGPGRNGPARGGAPPALALARAGRWRAPARRGLPLPRAGGDAPGRGAGAARRRRLPHDAPSSRRAWCRGSRTRRTSAGRSPRRSAARRTRCSTAAGSSGGRWWARRSRSPATSAGSSARPTRRRPRSATGRCWPRWRRAAACGCGRISFHRSHPARRSFPAHPPGRRRDLQPHIAAADHQHPACRRRRRAQPSARPRSAGTPESPRDTAPGSARAAAPVASASAS